MIVRSLGRLLRNVHAGENKLVWNQREVQSPETITIASPAFENGGIIPDQFAGLGIGDNLSPPLHWRNLPSGAVELALVVEDPDAPIPVTSIHLIATAIAPSLSEAPTAAFNPGNQTFPCRIGKGVMGRRRYDGPTPPPGHGPHRYFFQIFALSHALSSDRVFDRKSLLRELDGTVLGRGRLIGIYERK
jgi:Raf kinase inhibitor-like YbhB/YbcL family protein